MTTPAASGKTPQCLLHAGQRARQRNDIAVIGRHAGITILQTTSALTVRICNTGFAAKVSGG
jgi:hypothetical protein